MENAFNKEENELVFGGSVFFLVEKKDTNRLICEITVLITFPNQSNT